MAEKDIKEILSEALGIANKQLFDVLIYRPNEPMYQKKEMTYMELGLFLTQKVDTINKIEIYMRYE